jgi:Arc/MetJ family transcription regulator
VPPDDDTTGDRLVIFAAVGEGRPYPPHGLELRDWLALPPQLVRLDELTTTRSVLDLHELLGEDTTLNTDLFAHVVAWESALYLEDGVHRAVRTALSGRHLLHARVHTIAQG